MPLVSADVDNGKRWKGAEAEATDADMEKLRAKEEEGLLDRPLWRHVSDRVTGILREGLGDRCVLARPLCGVPGEAAHDFQGEKIDERHKCIYRVLRSFGLVIILQV